jgi:cyanophycinase
MRAAPPPRSPATSRQPYRLQPSRLQRSRQPFAALFGVAACLLLLSLGSARANGEPLVRPSTLKSKSALYQLRAGGLLIAGGGGIPRELAAAFLRMAGGKGARLVVIPTASKNTETGERSARFWQTQGFAGCTILHTRDRELANRAEFCAPLRQADAVWICGGSQSRLAEAYRNTLVQRELFALLGRGAAIGGSSAGAAIQSEVMIAGGKREPEIRHGLGLLEGVVLDQHFRQRKREARLARALVLQPGHFGIGIDERTAIRVLGRRIDVLGEGQVAVLQAPGAGRKASYSAYGPGSRLDLVQLRRAAISRIKEDPPHWSQPRALTAGTLWLGGGGRLGPAIWKRFLADAGGINARILVVPTASGKQYFPTNLFAVRSLEALGARNVRLLDAQHWLDVDDEILEELDRADAVWLTGGRQWRLIDQYERTGFVAGLRRLLARGGVIGGSSAGASIQAECLVRGHPLGNHVMWAEGYERGFGLLPGAAVDQHFRERRRAPALAKLKKQFPSLLCIGIDERSAIRVQGATIEVLGYGQVSIHGNEDAPTTLGAGDRYPLPRRP